MAEAYELFTRTDPHELWGRIDAAADRFLTFAGEVDPGRRLDGTSWTTRDVVGHVLTVVWRYTRGPTLGQTPRDVDRINAEELADLAGTAADVLLDDLRTELKLAREMWGPDTVDLRMRLPFHGGVTVDAAAGLSNLVGELAVHGYDVARSAGRRWRIDERDAVLVLNGVVQILPAYARRDSRESLRVALRVAGARPWLLSFDAGVLTSEEAGRGEPVDVVVGGRAAGLLLAIYGRLSAPGAVRAGLRITGGRRPWRVARLPRLLERP
jgi:hypothetical protein